MQTATMGRTLSTKVSNYLDNAMPVLTKVAVRAKGWIESIRFYTKFVLNWDEHL